MKIGELAAATETPIATIRYYEREGLLAAPARTGANYRSYGLTHVQRLAFIRRCRSLDMSLDEVRVLLRFQDQPAPDCGEVNAVLDGHIAHVTQRVRELRRLEKHLRELRAHCGSARAGRACGILEQLNAAAHPLGQPGRKPVPRPAHGGLGPSDVHAERAPAKGL